MISIIICAKTPQITSKFRNNISNTVGVDYELITIDNSQNKHSIFAAYNEGVRKSKYPFLCFVHDDVLFKTKNWGQNICDHLNDKNIGVIGVAGGDLVTRIPGPWSISGQAKSFIQSDKSNARKSHFDLAKKNHESVMQEVILLDGLWLCMRRDIFDQIKFDDRTFNGFHSYDYDICIQAKLAGFKNFVVYDIIIEHFSWGVRNREWALNLLKVFNKWQHSLPITLNNYQHEEVILIEQKIFYLFVKRMIHNKFTIDEILDSVSDLWRLVFPDKTIGTLKMQLVLMKSLKTFRILGLKTQF